MIRKSNGSNLSTFRQYLGNDSKITRIEPGICQLSCLTRQYLGNDAKTSNLEYLCYFIEYWVCADLLCFVWFFNIVFVSKIRLKTTQIYDFTKILHIESTAKTLCRLEYQISALKVSDGSDFPMVHGNIFSSH